MPFEIPENIHPQLRPAGLADRHLARQRARGVPDDRGLPVRPGADLPAGRPPVHPLHEPGLDRRRRRQARPRGRPGDRLPACRPSGTLEVLLAHNIGFVEIWHGEIHAEQPRFEIVTDAVGRTEHRQGVRRRQAALRPGRRRPALRLRHGRDGPGAPAAHPCAAAPAVADDRWPTTSPTGCAGSGYRLTPQRELILGAVERLGPRDPGRGARGGPPAVRAINVSTVYRTLEVLEELGLVRHAHLSDRAPTYHSTRDHEHFHLVCRNCQRVSLG